MENLESGLYIISTPIGNLEDISSRAVRILSMVDLVICENPVHSLKLLNKLGIKKKLLSLHDYNELSLIKKIEKNQYNLPIALISDAGSPLISDPGYNLVKDYINKEIPITTLPGPSSVISALQLSGLPINNFAFFGFVPKNNSAVKNFINRLISIELTSVFFVSGLRLLGFLKDLKNANLKRRMSISKEITKKNERVFRGDVDKIIEELLLDDNNFKGEFVVVFEGKNKKEPNKLDVKINKQIEKLLKKFSLTETVEIVHKLTNISKKEIYSEALLHKDD